MEGQSPDMTEATGIVGEFFSLKEETDAEILTMQCGDFYEFFGEDAEIVSEELDLKVSQKSSHGSSYPMAGVPIDDLTPYLKALVERGYRVAVADQYETDSGHAREIVRVVTPAPCSRPATPTPSISRRSSTAAGAPATRVAVRRPIRATASPSPT